jgi:ribosomal subunit interface protein
MELLVRSINFDNSAALHDYATRRVQRVMKFLENPAVRLQVSLSDENGPRGGEDKCCRIRLLGPRGGTFVEATHADPYAAVDIAADRLAQALQRRLQRKREAKLRPRGLRALVQELPPAPQGDDEAA